MVLSEPSSCRQLETWIQCLRRAGSLLNNNLPEDQTTTMIQAQMPHLGRDDVGGYVHFAERMGSEASSHLEWVCGCVREFVPYGRVAQGAVLKAIAQLDADKPNLKRCLTFAALQCPSRKVLKTHHVGWISGLVLALAKLLRRHSPPSRVIPV